MKIIFLDFDGVITTAKSGYAIDPEKVDLLLKIIEKTDAKIVVSSSWRRATVEATKEYLSETAFVDYIVGVTRKFDVYTGERYGYLSVPRGMEIKFWLDTTEENIESYVILDDETDMLIDQEPYFILTDMYLGLSEEDVEKAIKILNDGTKTVDREEQQIV